MRNTYGQLAGQNSLIIDTRITPSGLKTVLDTETKYLNHLLQFISKKSLANGITEIYPSKKELKELKSKTKNSFIYKCITSKYNPHLKFKDLFNEDTLMALFEIFIKTIRNFDKDSTSFNFDNINATYIELKSKIEINLSLISKTVKNKDRGLNSSDENELIHSAIKTEKYKSNTHELSDKQIDKICKHFDLTNEKGKRKFNLLYNLHHEQASLESEQGCIFKNIEDKNTFLEPALSPEEETKKNQEESFIKLQSIIFKTTLKSNDIKIFNSRIFNEKYNYIKLNELSKEVGKSPQALNQKEKIIKENFISFCKKNLKIKNSG